MTRLLIFLSLAVVLLGCDSTPDKQLDAFVPGKACLYGHWYFLYMHSAAPIFGPDGKPIHCEVKP